MAATDVILKVISEKITDLETQNEALKGLWQRAEDEAKKYKTMYETLQKDFEDVSAELDAQKHPF